MTFSLAERNLQADRAADINSTLALWVIMGHSVTQIT